MSKLQSIQLSIPKPCKVGWDNMHPNSTGRHCDSCDKTVIDFSKFTDRELASYFKNLKGGVCGHMTSFQLNRVIAVQENTNRSFLHKIFYGTALASWLGFSASVVAQSTVPQQSVLKYTTPVKDSVRTDKSDSTIKNVNGSNSELNQTQYIIDGFIVSTTPADNLLIDEQVDYFEEYDGNVPAQFEDWSSWLGSMSQPFFVSEPPLGLPKPSYAKPYNSNR
jgi:hypothetical protein